jgi:hypothetical protein
MTLQFCLEGLPKSSLYSLDDGLNFTDFDIDQLSEHKEKIEAAWNKANDSMRSFSTEYFKNLEDLQINIDNFEKSNKKIGRIVSERLMEIDRKRSLIEVDKVRLSINNPRKNISLELKKLNDNSEKLAELRNKFVDISKNKINKNLIYLIDLKQKIDLFKKNINAEISQKFNKIDKDITVLTDAYMDISSAENSVCAVINYARSIIEILKKRPDFDENIIRIFELNVQKSEKFILKFRKRIEILKNNLKTLSTLILKSKGRYQEEDLFELFESIKTLEEIISNNKEFVNGTKNKYDQRFGDSLNSILGLIRALKILDANPKSSTLKKENIEPKRQQSQLSTLIKSCESDLSTLAPMFSQCETAFTQIKSKLAPLPL